MTNDYLKRERVSRDIGIGLCQEAYVGEVMTSGVLAVLHLAHLCS